MVYRAFLQVGLILALCAGAAHGQTKPIAIPPTGALTADQLIAALTAESEKMLSPATKFVARRPHVLVTRLAPDQTGAILEKIATPLTGDPARDTFIRYHLLDVVIKHVAAKGGLPYRSFNQMYGVLPPAIAYTPQASQRWDPPEIGAKYHQLVGSCAVTTGFPPFQKKIGPPESFEYMDAERRRKCEVMWAEAQTLAGKFKTVTDPEAEANNSRMRWILWMHRQVRGEALSGMLASNDAAALDSVIAIIVQQLRADREAAADSIAFLNAAYFDGWLGQYDDAKLKVAAGRLKTAVVTADKAADPAGKSQELSELAFTVITAMQTGNVSKRPSATELTRTATPVAAGPIKSPVTPEAVDLDIVSAAIERGVAALEQIRPPDTDLGKLSFSAAGAPAGRDNILPGQYALAAWSMLAAGESFQDMWMQKRVSWVACFESQSVYDRSMRLQALGRLPAKRWEPWIRRDAAWLTSAMTDQGGFNPEWSSEKPAKGFGDNANAQYAALAFWAAEESGFEMDAKVWKRIDQYWREAQFPAKGSAGAGWATRSYKAIKPSDNLNDFANRVAGPMTAGGVLSLSLCERYLNGAKRLDVGSKVSPELARGIAWLDEKFSFESEDRDSDFYYYMWTIQNVGQATGYRTFNKVDWFRLGTARLLNEQGPIGLWNGPKGPVVSTAFALAYLSRARGPLAICKLRFTPVGTKSPGSFDGWNNRPNDMVNFVGYVSKQSETPTNWQIADLDQPVYELAECPLLYLATDKAFVLDPANVQRLREYLDAGGMLVAAPEGTSTGNPLTSMRALAKQLYPNLELRKAEPKHDFFNLFQKVTTSISVSTLDNGVRPLMVIVEKDISRDLQLDATKGRDVFNLLTNIYMYAAGNNFKRSRLATNYVIQTPAVAGTPLQIARIKHAGEFDPEPMALPQLKAILAKRSVDAAISIVAAGELDKHQVAFLTVDEHTKLEQAESAALRKWIEQGGTLWIDVAGGRIAGAVNQDAILSAIGVTSNTLKQVEQIKVSLRPYVDGDKATLQTWQLNGRDAVYVTRGDLTSGLAGLNHWRIAGPTVQSARQWVVTALSPAAAPPVAPPAIAPTPATQPASKPVRPPRKPKPPKPGATAPAAP